MSASAPQPPSPAPAAWRAWVLPVVLGVALVLSGFGVKVWWEASRQVRFIEEVAGGAGDEVVLPELVFAAAQSAPLGPSLEALDRIEALARQEATAQSGRRALVVASGQRRWALRPEVARLEAAGAGPQVASAEAQAATPSALWRLLAAGLLIAWWAGVAAWIWGGYGADGAPRSGRWRSAALSAAGFVGWCGAMFMI